MNPSNEPGQPPRSELFSTSRADREANARLRRNRGCCGAFLLLVALGIMAAWLLAGCSSAPRNERQAERGAWIRARWVAQEAHRTEHAQDGVVWTSQTGGEDSSK